MLKLYQDLYKAKNSLIIQIHFDHINLRCLHSGGVKRLHNLEFALNLTQTSIFLSMHVLSTIVQKGGD